MKKKLNSSLRLKSQDPPRVFLDQGIIIMKSLIQALRTIQVTIFRQFIPTTLEK